MRTLVGVASIGLMFYRYGCQLRFLLRITPNTGADGLGLIVNKGQVRGQAVLCLVVALVECTRVYFKQCPMTLSPLQAPLIEALQHSAVILCCFAKGHGAHIVDEA